MNQPRFKILRQDLEHVLLDSETRPGEVSHSLEKVDGQWVCSCEWRNEGGNGDCKHQKWVREQDQAFLRQAVQIIHEEAEGPEFWELAEEEQSKVGEPE
jgi:hypothetical protein